MNTIPNVLLTDIVRRVGKHGFRELGPLITAGPATKAIVFSDEVLKDADIDEFIFVSRHSLENSRYRPFLLKCLAAGNVTANYVEGLRLAVQTGPSQRAIDLLASATDEVIYAQFALAAFLICSGAFDQGMEVFFAFFNRVGTIEEAVGTAEMVIHLIADMGILPSGLYDKTLRFGGLPHCVLNNFSLLHLCPKCFAFKYATRIQEMC